MARLQSGIVSSGIEFLSIDGLENTPSNRLFIGESENEEIGLVLLGTNSRGDLRSIHMDPSESDALILMVDSMKVRGFMPADIRDGLIPIAVIGNPAWSSEYRTRMGFLVFSRRRKHRNTIITVTALDGNGRLVYSDRFTL